MANMLDGLRDAYYGLCGTVRVFCLLPRVAARGGGCLCLLLAVEGAQRIEQTIHVEGWREVVDSAIAQCCDGGLYVGSACDDDGWKVYLLQRKLTVDDSDVELFGAA